MITEMTRELVRRYLLHYGICSLLALVFSLIIEYDDTATPPDCLSSKDLWLKVQELLDYTYVD